jgi:hypothetical protein
MHRTTANIALYDTLTDSQVGHLPDESRAYSASVMVRHASAMMRQCPAT